MPSLRQHIASVYLFLTLGFTKIITGLLARTPRSPPSESSPDTSVLIRVPTDVLHIVLRMLYDTPRKGEIRRYNYEICQGSRLIPLSETCRYMRAQTLPWIYREVYNWCRGDEVVWPEVLWRLFVTVHIRERSIQHPAHIPLSPDVSKALPMMGALQRVTLRLESPIPPELLAALASVPQLSSLEIHQARFDGPPPPRSLRFRTLESLLICICGFEGVIRAAGIDPIQERHNVGIVLGSLAENLTKLRISGDLLPTDFCVLRWPRLRNFAVTEHTPTPYVPVPDLVSQMPALRQLSVLYSADLSRPADGVYPPFRLGTPGGGLLTTLSPLLNSVTLSNMAPSDPIFAQLPESLEALHLLAMRDLYVPGPGAPQLLRGSPVKLADVPVLLEHISQLDDLVTLSLTLKEYCTPDVIASVAAKWPRLRSLQLGHSVYSHGNIYLSDVRDDTLLEALRRFPFLTDLKISLDFREREFQEGPQESAARWILQGLPNLRTVAFTWEQWRWWWYHGLEPFAWRTWDRRVMLRSPTPPPSDNSTSHSEVIILRSSN